jgi:hypothetical protein
VLETLKNIIKTAGSFLTNQAPPGIDREAEKERLQDLNHLESKKFFIVMTSVLILTLFFFCSVGILFCLPQTPEIINGFITLFTKTIEILAIVIAFYVSAKTAVDLKYNSNSNTSISNVAETITEKIEETITVIHTNQKEEDYELN